MELGHEMNEAVAIVACLKTPAVGRMVDFCPMKHCFIKSTAACALALATSLLTPGSVRADILYVSNYGDNTIAKFTSDGIASTFASNGLNHPLGIAFDHTGVLYAVNGGNNTIEKFDPTGVGSVFATNNPAGNVAGAFGLAFDNANVPYTTNNYWAANVAGYTTIEKFSSNGAGSYFSQIGYLSGPLAFDRAGNLYVANTGFGTIEKVTPNGVRSDFASTTANRLLGLAFDSAGNLYVAAADHSFYTIEKFTADGVHSVFANTGLNFPYGLAFDSAGNLFVANAGDNTIEKFTPDGVGTVFASSGINQPRFLAFTDDSGIPLSLPVPEPSVFGLFVTGSLLLATRLRNA